MKKVYVVEHCRGIDGSYIVGVFSKKEDAEKLVELHDQSDDSGDYSSYYCAEYTVDEIDVNDYYLYTEVDEEGNSWTDLKNTSELDEAMYGEWLIEESKSRNEI